MKKDIILCGVGGDGIVSVAKIISDAALNLGLNVKQSEIHGMSQRGGSVFSHLRVSSEPIFADVIPEGKADIILSSEPMEALRYQPWLAKEGWIITNTTPLVNIPNYPDMEAVRASLAKLPNVIAIDVDAIAKESGSPRSANMVLLGAAASVLGMLEPDKLRDGIRSVFMRKGQEIVDANIKAFDAGLASAVKR